jgi:hypothetical protein
MSPQSLMILLIFHTKVIDFDTITQIDMIKGLRKFNKRVDKPQATTPSYACPARYISA